MIAVIAVRHEDARRCPIIAREGKREGGRALRAASDAIAVGADDLQHEGLQNEGQALVMLCQPTAFAAVQAALLQRAVPLREAGLAYVPTTRVELVDLAAAQRMMKLVDALEDHDDVHAVYSNEAFPDAIVQALEADS